MMIMPLFLMLGQVSKQTVISAYVTAVRPGYELEVKFFGKSTAISSDFFKDRSVVFPVKEGAVVVARPAKSTRARKGSATMKISQWMGQRLMDDKPKMQGKYVAKIVPLSQSSSVKLIMLRSGYSRPITRKLAGESSGGCNIWGTGRGDDAQVAIFPDSKFATSAWRDGKFIVILKGDLNSISASVNGSSFKKFPRIFHGRDNNKSISFFNICESTEQGLPQDCPVVIKLTDGEQAFRGVVRIKFSPRTLSDGSWQNDAESWIEGRQLLWSGGFKSEAYLERFRREGKAE
jgi:hypothetical protein